ncbi:hypothetical protein BAUCODRAFT_78782 [Baudoinia panamericana UAMH 10762]|uniref:UPF3 domain-containing protein n=1 Tax=Baudoinia panamericana (strain UAMH 10762) TaxID=717646 RepID=M2LD10_BAUPA|nr:uncharacterized protein BAUCODRAFT_78782 [Baudoinia panamericana UAMH 10762]EMC91842.1 hypothetical protein BAUCODRAFT_78782 [Baudoinia panamericana UAMH 10762]
MPPKTSTKTNDRPGVLPVNAAVRAASTKTPAARLKLEIRRLPPGLTLSEFEETLGDDWKLSNGKVDWREYRQGKIKAPGKVPEQSRCYLHVVNDTLVREFEQRFLQVLFQDKAGTHRNPDLKFLPPTLGFAPNQRTPLQSKSRADNRQGTIDQDPEFIAFLEAETQPLTKPGALDIVGAEKERVEVKTTPLIEDLREKKANKAKAAADKADKKKAEEKKGPPGSDTKDVAAEKDGTVMQQKVQQAAKDAAKVLNKQAFAKQQSSVDTTQPTTAKAAASARLKKPAQSPRQQNATPRPRATAEGIKKMLQKDLGIKPKPTPAAPASSVQPASLPSTTPTAPSAQGPTPPIPTAPAASRPLPSSLPHPATTKAYLKHANPSQGMTEMLILRALSEYGEVTNVTIDPRKGTAIAVFSTNEGLQKAMQARRVPVANGAVEVLEFKDAGFRSGAGPAPRGRGGYRGGRGGAPAGRMGGMPTPPPPVT